DGAAAAGAGPTIDWPDSRPIGCVRAGSEATGVGAALAPAWVEVSPALFGGSRPSTEAAPGAGSPSFRYRYPAPRTATRPDVTSTPTHRGPLERLLRGPAEASAPARRYCASGSGAGAADGPSASRSTTGWNPAEAAFAANSGDGHDRV